MLSINIQGLCSSMVSNSFFLFDVPTSLLDNYLLSDPLNMNLPDRPKACCIDDLYHGGYLSENSPQSRNIL